MGQPLRGPPAGLNVYEASSGKRIATLACGPGRWNSPIVVDGKIILPEDNANSRATTGVREIWTPGAYRYTNRKPSASNGLVPPVPLRHASRSREHLHQLVIAMSCKRAQKRLGGTNNGVPACENRLREINIRHVCVSACRTSCKCDPKS